MSLFYTYQDDSVNPLFRPTVHFSTDAALASCDGELTSRHLAFSSSLGQWEPDLPLLADPAVPPSRPNALSIHLFSTAAVPMSPLRAEIISIGETIVDKFAVPVLGGAPLNVAFRLHEILRDVALVSAVNSQDSDGVAALARMRALGLRTDGVQHSGKSVRWLLSAYLDLTLLASTRLAL